MNGQQELIRLIKEISAGNYSDEIMELTKPEYPAQIQELAEAVGMMMVKIEAREFHLERLYERIKENALKTVTSIASALGRRDTYTEGHAERVSAYAVRMGRRLGLDDDELELLRIAGLLHDIGKIGFSDKLFAHVDSAPTDEMFEEIRSHPDWGFDILKGLDFLGPALDYVHCHHERPDGKGYPHGMKEEDIPLGARILSVADTYDAMTTDRPYQKGKTDEQAFAIMEKIAGTQLDATLVGIFIREIKQHGRENGGLDKI